MMTDAREMQPQANSTRPSSFHLGFWAALLLSILAGSALVLGITTPPRSGPFCTGNCIAYPFTDAARFVPRDYLWVMPGILLAPLFVIVACCLSVACVEERKRHLSLISICLASISATILAIDYFIQFQVVEPSLMRGEVAGLALFTQYNPHGLFIALEDLGYLMLSAAFLFVGVAIPAARAIGKAIRWTFLISFLLSYLAFAAMSWHFGLNIEYRFEVTIITIVWTTLIVSGILLSIYFRDPFTSSQTD
jgi:hypothetical protein